MYILNDDSLSLINVVDSKHFEFKFNSVKQCACACTFCGQANHTVDNCFKKHGVPPHIQKHFQLQHTILPLMEVKMDWFTIALKLRWICSFFHHYIFDDDYYYDDNDDNESEFLNKLMIFKIN